MKLQELINELEEQRTQQWDKRIQTTQLAFGVEEDQVRFHLNGDKPYSITQPCHSQIADRLEIPIKYYHKMRVEEPELLTLNVNTWLEKNKKEVFVRGLGNNVRAFLSDRYRVIDHLDTLYCALNELQAHHAEIEDCYLSETELNLKIKSNQLKDFVRHREDIILGGLLLTNSETGHKALKVEPRVYRVLCTNGMVVEDFVTRQIHLGNGDDTGDEPVYLSVRRSIKELFGRFGEIVHTLRDSTEIKVNNPQKLIHNVVEQYRLSDTQKDHILMAFGAEPEHDQYGIANAITRAAHSEENWERTLELERLGGRLATLPMQEFKGFDQN